MSLGGKATTNARATKWLRGFLFSFGGFLMNRLWCAVGLLIAAGSTLGCVLPSEHQDVVREYELSQISEGQAWQVAENAKQDAERAKNAAELAKAEARLVLSQGERQLLAEQIADASRRVSALEVQGPSPALTRAQKELASLRAEQADDRRMMKKLGVEVGINTDRSTQNREDLNSLGKTAGEIQAWQEEQLSGETSPRPLSSRNGPRP